MLISLIVVVFLLLSKNPFFWHLRNLLFPSQRLHKPLEILIALVTPYAKEKMTPPHQCVAQAEEWCQFSCFPPPVLPWSAGSPWRWPRLQRGATFSLQHFAVLNCCWSFLHFLASLSLWAGHWHTLSTFFSTLTCWGGQHSRERLAPYMPLSISFIFLTANQIIRWRAYFGKAKYSVVSGLVLNSHMFPA